MAIAIDIRVDLKRATQKLKAAEKRHVPFATSVALNRTAFDLQQIEKKGAAADIDRPVPYTISGIRYAKSSKHNLTAKVFVEKERAKYLQWPVFGGSRKPRRKVLVIGMTTRNRYGNTPAFQRFRSTQLAKPRHFEATIGKTSGIWKRTGRAGKTKLELVALYAREADYSKTYRFGVRAFRDARAIFRKHFREALEQAIARG